MSDKKISKLFNDLCKEHYASGARLIIANQNEFLVNECYGMASIERNEETTPDTIYRIASISKTIGAIGLMILKEKGLLCLDDDISDIFGFKIRNPKFPDKKITVRMITTQTSSILDGYDDEELDADIPQKGYNGVNGTNLECTLKDLLIPNDGPYYTPLTFADYAPGDGFNYSNFGCGIMACIIEKVSGIPFTNFMTENVFKPLQINANFVPNRLEHQEKIADMYQCYRENQRSVYKRERFINNPYTVWPLGENYRGPAGGLFISIEDLAKLMQMFINKGVLNNVRILKEETVEEMYQMQWAGTSPDEYRAKGVQMRVYQYTPNHLLRGHTGGAYGVKSYLFFDLQHKIGGCFITNGFLDHHISKHTEALFVKTLNAMIDEYTTYIETNVDVNEKYIDLGYRKIFYQAPVVDEYYPLLNVIDALNLNPVFDTDGNFIINTDNGSYIPGIKMINDTPYVNLDEILLTLKINYQKSGNGYKFNY